MNRRTRIFLLLFFGAAALVAANYAMLTIFFGPGAVVRSALRSDSAVQVSSQNSGWLVFTPHENPLAAGMILYPEGYQDTRMYAPISRQIAASGCQIVLLSRREKFPLSTAEEETRVRTVMAAYPHIQHWFIGAHTWEASLAANFAIHQPEKLAGVVLWAGRLEAETSLAESRLPVLYIYGTLDDENEGLLAANRTRLPAQTKWVPIAGGNRVNFANFGPMPRDVGAEISIAEQQQSAAAATIEFINSVLNGSLK